MKKPKNYWSHRIIVTRHVDYFQDEYLMQEICEVHFKDGIPIRYASVKLSVEMDDEKGLEWIVTNIPTAFSHPPLWGGDRFPEEYKK